MQVLGEICENLSLSQQISDDDLERVKRNFLNLQTETITALMDAFEITWQKTCSRRQLEIVKKLLLDEMTSRGQMENDAYCQSLALDIAAGNGNLTRVKQLCEPHLNQPLARNNSVRYGLAIPVVRASNAGHKKVTDYLYYNHYKRTLPLVLENDNDVYWATCLLLDAIFYGFLDIALDIIKHLPSVAVTKHARQRLPIYKFIAVKPDLFRSHCNFGFWRHLIYSCIRVSENPRPNRDNRLFCMTLPQSLLKWFGIKQTYDLKKRHSQAQKLLKQMCTSLRDIMAKNEIRWKETVYEALLEAAKSGNRDFFIEIIKCNSQLLWILNPTSGRNLFQLAVEFKKEKIFNLIHGLDDRKVTLLRSYDKGNNNILHIAGRLSTPDQLSKISGAALKMQRESQWFKEVESLVSEREVVQKNKDNKTPRQIFEHYHEHLRKEGEEWMKYTATACSFVAALIATVTFQAIFTVPGGIDGTSGSPLILNDLHFRAFIFTDTLAFFASCISVLIFLSILTSRYSFDDFIVSLPRKMILGQSILFISIASMLVAFITSLSASMRHKPALVYPLKPLASFPSLLFLMLQYPLLKEMISSTYGKRLFYRDTKNWLP
ncbi:Ankyrin-repeat containing protein [Arabidopsis thaliana]|jgi:hypothetical protein|uniref:Ankyrin-repeat containing protein n=1 Tax=Arabidopsis thaliana TaxID=3702 RepID=F4JXP4_ARATH|nr:Ankyrin-repeat containing protein [Arabidopsis thaliana]AED90776.1 Ankyrin-repeat containing protein [Arabidopsis thaliana]|eukprot:NP_196093.2 Ankyrin-repeat containing protein [Arabidopsis thaliana]